MNILNKKRLFFIFLLALSIRLIFWIFVVNHPEGAFDSDSGGYLSLAERLLESHTFPSILRTPVYPFFIASVYFLFGKFPQAVLVFQCLLDSSTAMIVVLLFFRIFQNARYSLLAGFIYAINPFAVFYSNMILTETLFTFILAVMIYHLITFLLTRGKKYLVVSAIFMGIAVLCRPIALYISLLLVPCFFIGGYKLRGGLINSLIFLTVSYMMLVPWYVKNYRDYGRWTLSAIGDLNYLVSFAPEVLMIKDNPLSVATFNVNERIERYRKVLWRSAKEKYGWHEDEPSETGGDKEHFALLVKEGKRVVYENAPIFFVSHLLNIGRVLCPYHPDFEKIIGNNARTITAFSFIMDFFIMGFFAAGLVISLRGALAHGLDNVNVSVLIMVFLIIYLSFIPGVVGYSRFRVPILPCISVFSAFGVWKVLALTRSAK